MGHWRIRALGHSITPSPHHPITPSPHHPITPSPHHPITPSPHHPITPSPHHPIIPTPRPAGSPPGAASWSRPFVARRPRFSQSARPWEKSSGAAGEIGDAATCLFDHHGTGRMIPDLLAVIRPARGEKPRENLSAAGGQDSVLRLAIECHRWCSNPQRRETHPSYRCSYGPIRQIARAEPLPHPPSLRRKDAPQAKRLPPSALPRLPHLGRHTGRCPDRFGPAAPGWRALGKRAPRMRRDRRRHNPTRPRNDRLRRKPFVPSIGSSVQNESLGSWQPRSNPVANDIGIRIRDIVGDELDDRF